MYVLASSGQSSCSTQFTEGKSVNEVAKYLFQFVTRKYASRISDLMTGCTAELHKLLTFLGCIGEGNMYDMKLWVKMCK